MQVSAISRQNSGLYMNSNRYNGRSFEQIGDNIIKYTTLIKNPKKADAKMQKLYENIAEWKNFCHEQILGEKLNVIV